MPENYPPRRRQRKPRFQLLPFLKQYFFPIASALMCCVCLTMIVLTVVTVSGVLAQRKVQASQPDDTSPNEVISQVELDKLLIKADKLAAGYDYTAAISLLQTVSGYETVPALTDRIAQYTEADKKLVPYSDLDNITHIFFHSLIVDPERAFDGDDEENGYNLYMVTVSEFRAILQSMYDKGYVLVSPYDIAYESTRPDGSTYFAYGNIRLPEGKTPFLLSQDDVNYYGYMIGSGNGLNEKPVFADTNGDGFASRIVIGEDGYPTCEYMDKDGNVTYGEYDIVPILEAFIQEHPDFSYHGARAILGMTGYEGVFGYRTKPGYNVENGGTMTMDEWNAEVEAAKEVAQCLRDHGWILASHSYGHMAYGASKYTPDRVEADSDKWEDTVETIIGETDIILYAHGSDVAGIENYTMENKKFAALYEDGYRYFFNVDSRIAWTQIGENYFRGSRRNIDGYRMYHGPQRLEDLFDAAAVMDPARPLPVPEI